VAGLAVITGMPVSFGWDFVGSDLVANWVDRVPPVTDNEMMRDLAIYAARAYNKNYPKLNRMWFLQMAALVAFAVEVAGPRTSRTATSSRPDRNRSPRWPAIPSTTPSAAAVQSPAAAQSKTSLSPSGSAKRRRPCCRPEALERMFAPPSEVVGPDDVSGSADRTGGR
jgi:hypothetical protein